MPPHITIGLAQMRCGGTPAENMTRAVRLAERAQLGGANVVVLPELFRHPYFCQSEGDHTARRAAEPVPGRTTDALSALARRLGVVLVGGTLVEAGVDGAVYNTAPVFDADGRLLGSYRKSRIPMDEGFYEQSYFAAGDGVPGVYRTAVGTVGVLVCYDQWFPELARAAALAGAEVVVYPSAVGDIDHLRLPDENNWQRMWRNAHLGHTASNNVFVAAVNRVGHEGRVAFWGGSFVLDPSSRVLAEGGCAEELVLAGCDLGRVRELQEAWGFLRTHRAAAGGEDGPAAHRQRPPPA